MLRSVTLAAAVFEISCEKTDKQTAAQTERQNAAKDFTPATIVDEGIVKEYFIFSYYIFSKSVARTV